MNIWMLTMKDGDVVIHKHARPGVSLEDMCETAECEVNGGFADYARVTVDGEIYIELEA